MRPDLIRVTWVEAERMHPGCGPALDYAGLTAGGLYRIQAAGRLDHMELI